MKRLVAIVLGIKFGLLGLSLIIAEQPVEVVEAYEDPRPVIQIMTDVEYEKYLEEKNSEPILVEAEIEWTREKIDAEVSRVFPDAPIMHKVMQCESGGYNDAYNPTNGSHDNGLFQISDLYHGERVRALGLDVGNPADNIAYARILYDESGLQPWSASKECWSK